MSRRDKIESAANARTKRYIEQAVKPHGAWSLFTFNHLGDETYTHVGIAETREDAQAWLNGGEHPNVAKVSRVRVPDERDGPEWWHGELQDDGSWKLDWDDLPTGFVFKDWQAIQRAASALNAAMEDKGVGGNALGNPEDYDEVAVAVILAFLGIKTKP